MSAVRQRSHHVLPWTVTALLVSVVPRMVVPSLGNAAITACEVLPVAVMTAGALGILGSAWRRVPLRGTNTATAWLFPLAMLPPTLWLAAAWSAQRSHGALIAGRLPFSDATDYLAGALRLLWRGELGAWCSRRPLNASFLAARLVLSHGSLAGALVLQAGLLGLATGLGARAVARTHGGWAGVMVAGAIAFFGAVYVPTTLSESLGFTFGALALATFWRAAASRRPVDTAVAFGVLTVGLNARSGPFTVLPMLLLWTAYDTWRARTAGGWRRVGAALGGVLLGFSVTGALIRAHHGRLGGANVNFAYTLYGLSRRGVRWDIALTEHPEVLGMGDTEAGQVIYRHALANIHQQPMDFIRGLIANVGQFAGMLTSPLQGHPVLQAVAFTGLATVAGSLVVRAVRRNPDDRPLQVAIAAAVGLVAAVPVIWVDGGERVFAAGIPLGMAAIAATLSALRPGALATTPPGREPSGWLAALVVGASLVLPRLGADRVQPQPPGNCPAPLHAAVIRRDVRPAEVTIVPGAVPPDITPLRLRLGIRHQVHMGDATLGAGLTALPADTTLAATIDLGSGDIDYYAFAPAAARATREPGPWRVCFAADNLGPQQIRRVVSAAR